MTEIERRLALPVDPEHVDRLAAEAAPYHDGYEIRSFVGPVPGELRASYVEIRNLLGIEAPHGDLELEVGQDTVEDLDVLEREGAQAGRTSVTAVALHDTAVVAYAHASVPAAGFHHVDQYGTLVHPDHRGHRLGMAVKCAQLRLLAERFPDRALHPDQQRRGQRPHGRDQRRPRLRDPPGVGRVREAARAGRRVTHDDARRIGGPTGTIVRLSHQTPPVGAWGIHG